MGDGGRETGKRTLNECLKHVHHYSLDRLYASMSKPKKRQVTIPNLLARTFQTSRPAPHGRAASCERHSRCLGKWRATQSAGGQVAGGQVVGGQVVGGQVAGGQVVGDPDSGRASGGRHNPRAGKRRTTSDAVRGLRVAGRGWQGDQDRSRIGMGHGEVRRGEAR